MAEPMPCPFCNVEPELELDQWGDRLKVFCVNPKCSLPESIKFDYLAYAPRNLGEWDEFVRGVQAAVKKAVDKVMLTDWTKAVAAERRRHDAQMHSVAELAYRKGVEHGKEQMPLATWTEANTAAICGTGKEGKDDN